MQYPDGETLKTHWKTLNNHRVNFINIFFSSKYIHLGLDIQSILNQYKSVIYI